MTDRWPRSQHSTSFVASPAQMYPLCEVKTYSWPVELSFCIMYDKYLCNRLYWHKRALAGVRWVHLSVFNILDRNGHLYQSQNVEDIAFYLKYHISTVNYSASDNMWVITLFYNKWMATAFMILKWTLKSWKQRDWVSGKGHQMAQNRERCKIQLSRG